MKKINSEGVCPFELKEIINIFPIKRTITVCKIVIPKYIVEIKTLKNGQYVLEFCNKVVQEIFSDYIDSKHIIIGHTSFYNDYQYILQSNFKAEVEEVLPKDSSLESIVIKCQIVEGVDFQIMKDNSQELPWEQVFTCWVLDGKKVTNYDE